MKAVPLWVNICAVVMLLFCGFQTYREKQQTALAWRQVEQLRTELATEIERIGILRAEWASLNNPERLAHLVQTQAPQLKLQPVAPRQLTTLEQVPIRPPEATTHVRVAARLTLNGQATTVP